MPNPDPASRAYLVVNCKDPFHLLPHPDHLILESSNNLTISIDQVRELIHWINLKPFAKKRKVALIRQAQKMTREAQNALLKALEEPPENTIIILTVNDERNLLPTVRSRCLRVEGGKEIGEWKEKSQINPQPSTFKPPASTLNSQISNLQSLLSDKSISELFDLANLLAKKDRLEIIDILNQWLLQLRQALLQNPDPTRERGDTLSKPTTLDQIKKIKYTQKALRANVSKRLALENLFLALQ